MDEETIYKIIYGLSFCLFTAIRLPHAKRNKKNVNKTTEGGRREKILVFVASIGMMVFPFIWILSDIFEWANMGLPSAVRIAGLVVIILSLWLFYWVHSTLGRNWSPTLEIRKGHTLVKEGPYERIRHPMYTQIWLLIIAQVFYTSNWVVGLTGVISWSILYFIRIPHEEKMMEAEFGAEYQAYKEETGRVFPKI